MSNAVPAGTPSRLTAISGTAVVPPPAASPWRHRLRVAAPALGIVAAIAVALAVDHGSAAAWQMDAPARHVVGVLALSIVLWMVGVIASHLVAIVMFALLLLVRVPAETAFSGFAISAFWLLVAALYFGFAMKKTGLATRIALTVLRGAGTSYPRILVAFLVIGAVFSLAIPSFTVRVAIMVPLAWSIVQRAGVPDRSRTSALIVVSAFEMAVLPGFATVTGSITGLYYLALFERLGLSIAWGEFTRAAALPALMCSLFVLGGNLLFFRPGARLDDASFVKEGLRSLGPVTSQERLTMIIIGGAMVLWSTRSWHGVDEGSIALLALAALFVTRVIAPAEFETGISWRFVIFMGGILSIIPIVPAYGIDKRLSPLIVAWLAPYFVNVFAVMGLVVLVTVVLRFVDTGGFVAGMLVFLSLYQPLAGLGVAPVVLAVATMFAVIPFWFVYQNLWFAMVDELTDHKAFSRRQQIVLATIYAAAVGLSLMVSAFYWYAVGLLPAFRLR